MYFFNFFGVICVLQNEKEKSSGRFDKSKWIDWMSNDCVCKYVNMCMHSFVTGCRGIVWIKLGQGKLHQAAPPKQRLSNLLPPRKLPHQESARSHPEKSSPVLEPRAPVASPTLALVDQSWLSFLRSTKYSVLDFLALWNLNIESKERLNWK